MSAAPGSAVRMGIRGQAEYSIREPNAFRRSK
jgi:hypothetical protein